ncbi:MAG: hypothetical protein AB1510_12630 [Bacillota bacterium]
MGKLVEAFRILEAAGCRLRPVPGTKWYELSAPEGWMVLVKEKDIINVLESSEPTQVQKWLQKINAAKGNNLVCIT